MNLSLYVITKYLTLLNVIVFYEYYYLNIIDLLKAFRLSQADTNFQKKLLQEDIEVINIQKLFI